MERRKFIAGLGSITAAGAAGIGTGAFSSVQANRDVAVEVADDSNAFLKLTAPSSGENTEYADVSGDTVSLDISGASTTQGNASTGLNKDASTMFLQLFKVTNQGQETVGLKLDNFGTSDIESMGWFVGQHGGSTLSHGDITGYDWQNPGQDPRILGPGGSVWVGAFFYKPTDAFEGTYTVTLTAANENAATSNGL